MDPLLIDPIAIADQDSGPLRDQCLKRLFAAARLHREQCHRGVGHHPHPGQDAVPVPRGLVHIVDSGTTGLWRDGLMQWEEGLGDAIHGGVSANLLYGFERFILQSDRRPRGVSG
jgi:hypothetical protein